MGGLTYTDAELMKMYCDIFPRKASTLRARSSGVNPIQLTTTSKRREDASLVTSSWLRALPLM